MKEQFVFKRDDLIRRIRANKDYPLLQINTALSKLIDDQNEYVSDMFGRLGHLVNIDEYYMFQPLELDNIQISRYERSHPISFKHEKLLIKIPKKKSETQSREIIEKIKEKFVCATSDMGICRRDNDKEVFEAIQQLIVAPFNIPEGLLIQFAGEHIFDSLSYNHKQIIMNFLWENEPSDEIFALLKKIIYSKFVIQVGDTTVLPLIRKNIELRRFDKTLLILKDDMWQEITKEEQIAEDYSGKIKSLFSKKELSNIYGIMGSGKSYKIKFKIINKKQTSVRNTRGFQCITQQKNKTLLLLNNLLKESPLPELRDITFETTKGGGADRVVEVQRGFSRNKLCNIEELLLRYYNDRDKKKSWFFSSFETQYNKIEKGF